MMETTIEQKREAVIAYCMEVCPEKDQVQVTDIHCVVVVNRSNPSRQIWEVMVNGKSFLIHSGSLEHDFQLMYRLLGLETRAAVEAERAEMMKTVDALTAMVSVDPLAFAELEAKNASLVNALENIQTDIRSLGSGYDEMDTFISKTRGGVSDALAANGKGEGTKLANDAAKHLYETMKEINKRTVVLIGASLQDMGIMQLSNEAIIKYEESK